MLKLVIADDERFVRETISNMIDWEKYDITLIGSCANGLEAYDMILDESPDIVITDIRMPGMDGLDLIAYFSKTDLDTQFIILSGYGEFDYAKRAMQYGVKQYLLKPCNESQIIEAIQAVKNDYYNRKAANLLSARNDTLLKNIHYNIISTMLNEILVQNHDYRSSMQLYKPFLDFNSSPYHLIYTYYVEQKLLERFLKELKKYCCSEFPDIPVHGIYVSNTLILFFLDYSADYSAFIHFTETFNLPDQSTSFTVAEKSFSNLEELINEIIPKIRRYNPVLYINDFHPVYYYSNQVFSEELNRLYESWKHDNFGSFEKILKLFQETENLNFLKQLSSDLFLKIAADTDYLPGIRITEWILAVNNFTFKEECLKYLEQKLSQLSYDAGKQAKISPIISQIYQYVNDHLQDSNLTLKYISENVLYMNVDYISKKFIKETGHKFSDYLNSIRIEKAKQYLSDDDNQKIQNIAELIGYGDNPQYFSQLFKKKTGFAPRQYYNKIHDSKA